MKFGLVFKPKGTVKNLGQLKDFTLTGAIARTIAENYWGRGGTTAYRTNTKLAYYYSCSAHGGYVVDAKALTTEQLKEIDKHHKPQFLQVLVEHLDNESIVRGLNYANFDGRNKSVRSSGRGWTEWVQYPVYLFEEHLCWAILEKLTNIRVIDREQDEEVLNKTFAWATK